MYLGKLTNGAADLIECEGGKEVNGERAEEELYAEGYKKACLAGTTNPTRWVEYPTCIVEEEIPQDEPGPEPQPGEISAEEALNIITGEAL